MRILIYSQCGSSNGGIAGQGHWQRCLALREYAWREGHMVMIAGNGPWTDYEVAEAPTEPGGPNAVLIAPLYKTFQPDWLVVDLPYSITPLFGRVSQQWGLPICSLGHNQAGENGVVMTWDQDRAERVILRPGLFKQVRQPRVPWFVFGGSDDRLGLVPALQEYGLQGYFVGAGQMIEHIFPLMAESERAVVAMGMVAWELAALRVPMYLFSLDEEHLVGAQRMEQLGLGLAWPEPGLPSLEELALVGFFEEEILHSAEPTAYPDPLAAHRLLVALEAWLQKSRMPSI